MRVNKEGYKIIVIAGLICLATWGVFYKLLVSHESTALLWCGSIFLILSWFFIVFFFREPKRIAIHDNELIFAPCDGTVVVIENVYEKEYLKENMIQISIFMSMTNIHMNWTPVGGVIEYFKYHPGRFLLAWLPKSSEDNEHTTTVVKLDSGHKILFKQIAGFLARRIVSYYKKGDRMAQNEVFGFIKFGSRMDLFIPANSEILVEIGDRTIGTQTPLARLVKNNKI